MSRSAAVLSASASAVVSLGCALVISGTGMISPALSANLLPPLAKDATPEAAPAPDSSTLRICASSNQLPYSSKDLSGFENKIAGIVASAMGKKAVFVFSDKPAIYLVRDWLNKNKCDVVVGVDSGDQRVLTTKPYYRAGYVFITRKDRNLSIDSWNDPKIKTLGHIVVDFGSPSEAMLKEVGKYNENMAYLYSLVGFRAPRNEYVQITPRRMLGEVQSGEADLAVAFAPDVSRFVKEDPNLIMVPVKDDATRNGGDKLPQQYDQSMAVRLGDAQLLSTLEGALLVAKPQIEAVLAEEGIPSLPLAH